MELRIHGITEGKKQQLQPHIEVATAVAYL